MEVSIKSCIEGAKEARGIVVVMDVFRASNTIISCLATGAEYIIPMGALEDAIACKQQFPDHILFGERKGLIAEGCEYGNSPFEASQLPLKDKKVIITTSAGSQGIVNATLADEILIGSFANAAAIVKYIKEKNPAQVSLIAIGLASTEKAEEDELCGQYIMAELREESIDFTEIKNKLLQCTGADRLRSLGQNDDLAFCTQLNTHDIIPFYDKETKKIICR